jgi:hypothetical protein
MPTDKDFFFYGNGCMGENPQDFIKKFESKDVKDTMSEEKKVIAFTNRLKSENTAEEWFDALAIADKATWADVKRVFLVRWPKKTASSRKMIWVYGGKRMAGMNSRTSSGPTKS